MSDAVRESLSLEGLVAAAIGGGAWAIAAGFLSQFTEFRIGPAIAAGAGVGLIAAAIFVWRVVIPQRDRERRKTDVLRSSARKHLSDLAAEGQWDWSQVMNPDESMAAWQRDVESFLLEAFGERVAREVMALSSVEEQAATLDELRRRLDRLCLRPGYRGWRRGG